MPIQPMNQKIEELKKLIRIELGKCDKHNHWPKLCELRSTRLGLFKIEELVIRYVAEEGMPIGSALALIEQELAHMDT